MVENYYFTLEDGEPVPAPDLIAWAEWFETADRDIAKTTIGDVLVSTVFLGLDHSFGEPGPPILFETMVFGGELDQRMERYSSLEDAMLGHERWVARVKA